MRLNILKECFSTFLKSGDKSNFKYGLVDCQLKDVQFQFKSPQFNDIAQQYYEAYEKKGDEEYEKLNEELQQLIQPYYLQDVSQIMNHFNMLDLSAWQTLVVQMCNNLEAIPLTEMTITLKQIFLFMSRKFRMQESSVEQYHYSEYELPLVFTENQLFTILNQLKFDQTQINNYLEALTTLLSIFFKFSRIQPISFYDVYEIVRKKLQIVLDNHLDELDLNNLITMYQSYGSESEIIEQIIQRVKQLDSAVPHRELDRILEIWKTNGNIDQDLLLILKSELLYQIKLTNKYQQNKVFQRIFALIYANVNDAEILHVIEKKLQKSTKLLESRNYSFQNGYLTCIKILKLRHPELSLPQIQMKPKRVSKQMQKSLQENILINFFRQYINSLDEKVKIKVDAPCWIYLIDVALLFQDAKIAFELSGSVYFRGNSLTGKKQAKKEIMISEGWKPIFLGNQEKILFNNFSFNQQQLPEQIERLFDDLFEKALGRKLQKKQH
ncbi:unnamed protein product [Paramecium octaurelia]|uniref:RAP domain-containing protein n=1 Tax=Paramecium octaurelia TaxID=43137 RepID=A0A8S1XJN3_PAROT|nr:unnamed protein product [Paramecium octaurelia]